MLRICHEILYTVEAWKLELINDISFLILKGKKKKEILISRLPIKLIYFVLVRCTNQVNETQLDMTEQNKAILK
jgi:hypothetical protein